MQIKTNKKFNYRAILGEENPLLRFPLLYERAVDEFSQKNYEEASLNEILKNANFSKSSLYHHFGDKFGLYLAVLDRIYQKKLNFFTPLIKENLSDYDFFSIMRNISKATMQFMFKDERLYHFSNTILESGSALTDKITEYFPLDYSTGFGPLIEIAIQKGQIEKKYSAAFLTTLLEVVMSNIHKLIPSPDSDESFLALNQVFDILESGCAAKEYLDAERICNRAAKL